MKKQVIFLHGYLSSGGAFAAQTRFFSAYFDCFAPDLPGFGNNAEMPYPYALSDYADWLKAYMKANGIERPHVVAHSFGARVAVKAAAAEPALFSRMVLTGAAGMKPRRPPAYYVKKARFSVLKKFLPREKLEKYYSSDYRALNAVMRESFLKIVNEHLEESSKRVQNPVLLVYGENDRETPLYMAKRYRRLLPSSRLLVIGGAGHFAFAEKIAAFNYPVREFLLAGKE